MKKIIDQLTVRRLAFFLALIGISATIGDALIRGERFVQALWNFLVGVGPELFGIAFTVLVIDWLNERTAIRERHIELIYELGSKDNPTALRAAEILRIEGGLTDGSLIRADLKYANLSGAILSGADLSHAYMSFANLQEADLRNCHLNDAILREANLQGALLLKADLSGAKLLQADLRKARCQGIILDDANLQGANLSGARGLSDKVLSRVETLQDAIMPNGVSYDGRFDS